MRLHARLFDDKGRFLREKTAAATWSLEGLKGTVANGAFTVVNEPIEQAGLIKASVGGLTGQARARVVRPLPWKETFDAYADGSAPPGWVNTSREVSRRGHARRTEGAAEGADSTRSSSAPASSSGRRTWSNYTFEADVRAAERRRQMGDVGITAQRYSLVLYGTSQQLKLEPWEPETTRTVTVPFAWKPDTWYRLKLRVENLPNGQVRARGKAWPAGEPEPAAWMIDKTDPIGNRRGSARAVHRRSISGVHLDNFAMTANQPAANR